VITSSSLTFPASKCSLREYHVSRFLKCRQSRASIVIRKRIETEMRGKLLNDSDANPFLSLDVLLYAEDFSLLFATCRKRVKHLGTSEIVLLLVFPSFFLVFKCLCELFLMRRGLFVVAFRSIVLNYQHITRHLSVSSSREWLGTKY